MDPDWDAPPAQMLDLCFGLIGSTVPRDHRQALAQALVARLPWLATEPGVAVHRINVSAGLVGQTSDGGPNRPLDSKRLAPMTGDVLSSAGALALLSGRSQLRLRVPRHRVAELQGLNGAQLNLGGHLIALHGPPTVRELLPHVTLYAHQVVADSDDELAFLATVDADLARQGVRCRRLCGRLQRLHEPGPPVAGGHDPGLNQNALPAYSLMLDGLSPADSLRMLEQGTGAHRLWGCGVFVPHKSAAAVVR